MYDFPYKYINDIVLLPLIKDSAFAQPEEKVDGGLLSPTDGHPKLRRSQSRAFLSEDGLPQPIEYFLASDPSAIVEHTKRVLYLEDDDIAHICDGGNVFYHFL